MSFCGMPQGLHLSRFGEICYETFGHRAYLVGSALTGKGWRDVDVRVMMPESDYYKFFDVVERRALNHTNAKWEAICMAFSALAKEMTGLPIDFQVQIIDKANEEYGDKPRSCLMVVRQKGREI